jgi:molybdopterin converting factor small subunit
MIRVTVSLFGEYRKYAGDAEFQMEVNEGATPRTIAEKLGIPQTPSLWVLVNGKREKLDHPLLPGSKVFLFQPVGGG